MDVRSNLAVKNGTLTVSDSSSTDVVTIDPSYKITTTLPIGSTSTASGTITAGDYDLVTGDAVYHAIDALTASDVGALPSTTTYAASASVGGSASTIAATKATTTKAYLLGTTLTASGNTTPVFDTGVYLTTTAGLLEASRLNLTSTTDAVVGSNAGVALRIGSSSGQHLDFDGNEIMSKSNASTASTLYLNNDGGQVVIGSGGMSVGGTITGNAVETTLANDSKLPTGAAVTAALTNGSVTKVGTGTVGGSLQPIYLSSGTPTAGTQLYNNKITVDSTASTIVTTGTTALTLASKSYVDNVLAASDAMIFKGTLGTGGTVTALPSVPYNAGWTYKVITAATYAGKVCEVGDLIICITDRASGATGSNDDWTVVQTNIDGAVTGPASATSGNIPLFDGTTGKIIKNSTYSPSSFATSSHNHDSTYLKLSGGTMTGVLTAKGAMYEDAYNGALNMNNSDIYGLNSIYTCDKSDSSAEGIHFYRSATAVDTFWVKDGNYYVTPNRTLGQAGTSYKIYHEGNKPSASDVGALASDTTFATINGTSVKSNTAFTLATTDTKVTETVSTTDNWYPILASPTANATATATTTSIFASGIKLNPAKTGIIGSQFGGYSKSYELQATGYKTILQMKDAATFWTTNSAIAYVTAKIEYSLVSFGSAATLDAKKAIWIVNAKYTGNDHSIDIKSIGDSVGTGNGILRYFASFAPKNSSYCPQIAVALDNANTKVYIRVTILSASEGWQCPSSIGGDPGTTNYNRWYVEAGRYNYTWSSNKIAANITGNCDGTAGSTWDSLRNDRYLFGESAVAGSIMAKASDGRMYKLRNVANKEFTLPLHLGRSTGTFTYNGSVSPPTLTNYAQIMWNVRGVAYTELTNTSMQGSPSFSVYELTSNDFGKTLYITGTLSNGNFKPDGNITLAMVNGKTNIPIGRIDRANVALNTVPTQFTITGYSQTAYTLDSNGQLTHIDGRQIKDYDYKVYQQPLGTANYNRPVLVGGDTALDGLVGEDVTFYQSAFTYNGSTGAVTATKFIGALQGNVTGNCSGTATTLAMAGSSSNTTLPTASNVTMYSGTILSQSGVWIIETYLSGNYGFQRATSLADACNVCVRTRNNSATWGDWTYSYAVWKV